MSTDETPGVLPSLPLRVAGLSARKPTHFAFHPNAADRNAIAAALGLIDLASLVFKGELRPKGRADYELFAQITARAVQACSITLAPVPATVAQEVHRSYEAEQAKPLAEEAEMSDDETEPLPEVLDIAAIAIEALALALPEYPRAPGATLGAVVATPPGAAPIIEAELKPCAALAGLAAKLKSNDSGGS
jgi:uncharacterized metal-binding protein YceD (DUF177 family)